MNLIDIIDSYSLIDDVKIAHINNNNILTYKDLAKNSNNLAHFLNEKYGIDKTPIVVYGHKECEMLECFLGCVKSGHAYIPVDSSLPKPRVKDIISNAMSKLIICVENLEIEVGNTDILNIDEINKIFDKNNIEKIDSAYQVKSDEPFYIIYTSGSTGAPKGVQITLSCLESFVSWGLKIAKLKNKNNVFMNQAPFSFDLSVMDLYLALCSGSTLFSIDKSMIANTQQLLENFSKSDISVWVSTPSFADLCLANNTFNEKLLPNLDLLLFCGETLTNSCALRLKERFPKARVVNTYGPTEATVAVTSIEVSKELADDITPLPVGYVKEDCSIMIVDKNGKQLPDEQKGEIVIAGDSVSIGYYNNIEKTNLSFSKTMEKDIIKRSYKTGDEGYIKDNMLFYSGRIDFQIKLNGFRIELEDIENNLRKIDFIKNSVVIPIIKDNKIMYLTAAVTIDKIEEKSNFKIGIQIKNNLKKLVPDYMVPRKIIIKDTLPMTPNGKVNRKLLMEELNNATL